MMKRLYLIPFLFLLLAGCAEDIGTDGGAGNDTTHSKITRFDEEDVVRGRMVVKLTPEAAERISITRSGDGLAVLGIGSIDALTRNIGAYDIKPAFTVGGKFEKRQREAGLHLYYIISFDEDIPVTRAAENFIDVDDITVVDPVPVIRRETYADVTWLLPALSGEAEHSSSGFNDPLLGDQWHYYNDGSLGDNHIKGSDINLFRAWEIETGRPEVIVAVLDGGVDGSHEDLAANMWDDGSGNWGYNFFAENYHIDPDDHGTHVAGTIAAVNNNGKGVGGIAGGDGTPGSGVRIMTCEIMGPGSNDWAGERVGDAFRYAADNGAVIAQNSWKTTYCEFIDAGIEYFADYAGTDEYGNQQGPVIGGLVICAAGNDGHYIERFPANHRRSISVASMGPNFLKASYSAWHETVDITAPGGEIQRYGLPAGVWSTTSNNKYTSYEGTSMSSPHVSGVAALIISHLGVGKPGLTAEKVTEALMDGTRDIYAYNSSREGMLGRGYVDAYKALVPNLKAPEPVTDYTVTGNRNSFEVSYAIPSDEDNGKPEFIEVFYATFRLRENNVLSNALVRKKEIPVGDGNPGDIVSVVIDDLDKKEFYGALSAVDSDRNRSEIVFFEGAMKAAWIEGIPLGTISVSRYGSRSYELIAAGAENLSLSVVMTEPGSKAASIRKKEGTLKTYVFTVDGSAADNGEYTAGLAVQVSGIDEEQYTIDYSIAGREFETAYGFTAKDESMEFDLSSFLGDPAAKEKTTYTAGADNANFKCGISGSVLTVTASDYGQSVITVRSYDGEGYAEETSFVCSLESPGAPGSVKEVSLYPNPMSDVLNVLVESADLTDVKVDIYNNIGTRCVSATVKASDSVSGRVDVSKLSSGYYRTEVSYVGDSGKKEYTRTVMKY